MKRNFSNRLVRTRMLGGVARAQSYWLPPMPMSGIAKKMRNKSLNVKLGETAVADWTAGYVADIGYTYGHYLELNPLRAQLAFLNAGLVPPESGAHCELGFGQGLSANIHAAGAASVWHGTDFNPAQAAFARGTAQASGANVCLTDEAFANFCQRSDLPEFELKVGSVLYISYNTLPGCAAFAPMRHLMTEYAQKMAAMVCHARSLSRFSSVTRKFAPMRALGESLVRLARRAGLSGLILAPSIALSGTVGFSVEFAPNEVVLTNTGSEAAYRLSMWTLDGSEKWQTVPVLLGNADYLEPQQQVKGRRQLLAATSGLAIGDPLLVMLFDKAGSRIVQLAWRQTPAAAPTVLPTQRHGSQLKVVLGNATATGIVASYGIAVPYAGVERLAHSFGATLAPPDPLRHVWVAGPEMTLDTGVGQGGAWLVHQSASGDLQMQIVADGRVRGLEQVPGWINWVRRNLMRDAQLLAALGALLLIGKFVWSNRGRHAPAALPGSHESIETTAK